MTEQPFPLERRCEGAESLADAALREPARHLGDLLRDGPPTRPVAVGA
jgi:hypothetical protein